MKYTEKTCLLNCLGRTLRFCNQKSRDWTHPYEYEHNGSNLSNAGCGIFALTHAVEWMHGTRLNPDEVAEVSVSVGGRGDDGTDRPVMLDGMMKNGFAAKCGFRYEGEGLLNDHERLWQHMKAGNTALCNLRVGHIVALLDWREENGKRQLLAMDSVAERAGEKVRNSVYGVVDGSLISYPIRNSAGLVVGHGESYALFWVDAELPRDFNLLIKTEPQI